jgi:mannose-6-phosphate isomerase-like protein (cupin superfamily)
MAFATSTVGSDVDATAPDGSDVRILLAVGRGSAAHFELAPGATSVAIHHRTVEEIWFVVGGSGEMWRAGEGREETVALTHGTCVSIPAGTAFQFRCTSNEPLGAFGVTMPPWRGDGEAIRSDGPWTPTVPPGPGLVAH